VCGGVVWGWGMRGGVGRTARCGAAGCTTAAPAAPSALRPRCWLGHCRADAAAPCQAAAAARSGQGAMQGASTCHSAASEAAACAPRPPACPPAHVPTRCLRRSSSVRPSAPPSRTASCSSTRWTRSSAAGGTTGTGVRPPARPAASPPVAMPPAAWRAPQPAARRGAWPPPPPCPPPPTPHPPPPRLRHGGDPSSEGVQRDLLPIIEGCVVSTKHGNVSTDHVLFICSGAFHSCKPSDMLAELQGRLPIRCVHVCVCVWRVGGCGCGVCGGEGGKGVGVAGSEASRRPGWRARLPCPGSSATARRLQHHPSWRPRCWTAPCHASRGGAAARFPASQARRTSSSA
jgi:hypothetical protein